MISFYRSALASLFRGRGGWVWGGCGLGGLVASGLFEVAMAGSVLWSWVGLACLAGLFGWGALGRLWVALGRLWVALWVACGSPCGSPVGRLWVALSRAAQYVPANPSIPKKKADSTLRYSQAVSGAL